MIVMTPEAGEREIEAVKAKLATTGVHVLVLPGELTTAIGAIGDPEGVRELGLEGMAGVDRVVPISRPYKLASSELAHHEPTAFSVDGRTVGGNETFCLIADRADRGRQLARQHEHVDARGLQLGLDRLDLDLAGLGCHHDHHRRIVTGPARGRRARRRPGGAPARA